MCSPFLPSSIFGSYAPVIEWALANPSATILDDVFVPVAAVAPTIDNLFFGLPELVDEGVNLLDG